MGILDVFHAKASLFACNRDGSDRDQLDMRIFRPDLRGVATETKGFNAARWPLEICDLRIDHWDLS